MSQRFEGKNLEEALTAAATALGVQRFQLRYHVLAEKRGFLGGVKRIVIEADVNEEAAPPLVVSSAPASSAARESSAPRALEGRRDRGRGGARRDRGGDRSRRRERGRPRPEQLDDGAMDPPPQQGAESAAAQVVHDWVGELVDRAGFRLDVRTEENDTQITVRLYGQDAPRLTDQHGELLDAIQVLTNKALVGRKVEKPVEFDAGEFKERREEELSARARSAADRVRREGREYLLPAMSPVERRIVHLTLRDDPAVTTESRGDGFYKRVAIILRADAPPPAES